MDKILLVCSSEKGIKVYTDNLKSLGYNQIFVESNGAAARRKMINDELNMIIIDTPLKDEFGTEIALKAAQSANAGVVLVVKSVNADMISSKVEDYGTIVIPKPFTKSVFIQSVKFVFTSLKRFKMMKKQENKLKKQVEDIKRIDRAKCLLIQYEDMTEEEAHRYIEKKAMDDRISRRDISEKIIKFYEV